MRAVSACDLLGACHRADTCRRVFGSLTSHEEEYSPFMSFGEAEEEDDEDYESYVARMKTDGEWAGQVELIAAAQALRVNIVVHQMEHPSYRIEYRGANKSRPPRDVHVSYHDGEHYNSVRSMAGSSRRRAGDTPRTAQVANDDGDAADTDDGEVAGAEQPGDADRLAAGISAARIHDGRADGEAAACESAARADEPSDGDEDALESTAEAAAAEAAVSERRLSAKEAKAKRKEEKRAKKEQRHREAVRAAQGAVDDSGDDEDYESQHTKVITL